MSDDCLTGSSPRCALLGIGNPLLDITIETDASFLAKYNLRPNDAIIADESHLLMFDEISARSDLHPRYVPGGATQNSIRVAQWLLDGAPSGTTAFVGAIGDDLFGKIVADASRDVGVNALYQVINGARTGVCVACITGHDRSLVTDLGAADKLHPDFVLSTPVIDILREARVIYIGGFVVPVCPGAVSSLLGLAVSLDKIVVMNLHAEFLCPHFSDRDLDIIARVDVLFGNTDEARHLARCLELSAASTMTIAKQVSGLPKANSRRERIVVFTDGCRPLCVARGGQVQVFPVEKIDSALIKDTNGCGDAFVGGFLSRLVSDRPLDECIRCGLYASRVVIQQYGCTFPSQPDFV